MHMISSFILRNVPTKLYISQRQLGWQNQLMEGVKGRKRGKSKETAKYSLLGTIMEGLGILFIEMVYK